MFDFQWQNLSKEFRGTLLMLFGLLLLFHTLNIFQKWLTSLLIITSIAFIIYGFMEANFWDKIKTFTEKK